MRLLLISLFSLTVVFISEDTLAAACCGGGFAAPSIIAGDDKAQISTSVSYTQVAIDNVDSNGIWRKWDDHQEVQTYRIEGAHLISDRWQAGLAIPVIQRSRLGQTQSGLGDIATSVAYEYLPDWDYNLYRPKGIGFLQLTLPTGKSRTESDTGLESRGNGFWALGAGTLLTKAIGVFDIFSSLEVHKSFAKTFSNSQTTGTLNPGWGGNFGLGGGYNFKSWRAGTSLTWTYEDPIAISGSSPSSGSAERYATASLSLSYLANDDWSGSLTYSDQTIIGSPVNTSLGRTVALQVQKRWAR